ncbi:MAG TPA: hypothetical protein VN231_14210, partial [Allosphingosinicella sp.]|nr:hypothetical protein [Allosphingosinicella sp.]
MRTRWIVRGSEGFDALSFLSPLSGDPFYAGFYEEAIAAFAPRLPAATMDSVRALKARFVSANILMSPFLDLRFSGGPDATIGDLLHSLDHAETVLRPPLEASPYWRGEGEESWRRFTEEAPILRSILTEMRAAGFAEFLAALFDAKAAERLPRLRRRLAGFDVVGEVERFTGRTLDPAVEVVLLEFCKPHGIKVIGQKFLSAIDWPDEIVIRTAGHELLHPPVAMDGAAAAAALAVLRRDPLVQRIVAEHDPAFGYNSLEGLFDEDLASSLDQLIGERLGVARDPRERWTDVDGGMHVLSAGFYGLMKRTGYAETGGDLEQWLRR